MFYVSKVSPPFFALALISLFLSLVFKLIGGDAFTFYLLIVFGFIGSVLVGAMYQIVPNSQNRKLSYPFISYFVFLSASIFLILTLMGLYREGAFILFLSYSVFFFHVVLNVNNWMPVTVKFLGASSFYLALSSLLLVLALVFGLVPFQSSVHALTVGAMLNAVYGVEVAWIPMLLMDTLSFRSMRKLFWAKQVSTVSVVVSFLLLYYPAVAVSSLLELSVALYYAYIIYTLLKRRSMPTPIPYVVRLFLVALVFLPFGLVAGGMLASYPSLITYALNFHIDLLVYGFVAFTVFGGMAHLLPRILWNWKLSKLKNAPTIGELVKEEEFPRFLEFSLVAFFLFLLVDLMFEPVRKVSSILYLLILGYFVSITFFHAFKKMKEVKDGGGKEA